MKTIFQLIDKAIREPKKPAPATTLSPDDKLLRAIGAEIEFYPDGKVEDGLRELQKQWSHTADTLAFIGDPALQFERLTQAHAIARESARTGNAEILANVVTKAELAAKRATLKQSLKKTLADISTEAGHLALPELRRFSREANEWVTDVVEYPDLMFAEQFGIPFQPSSTVRELRRVITTADRFQFGAEPRAILNILCWDISDIRPL